MSDALASVYLSRRRGLLSEEKVVKALHGRKFGDVWQ
jgi:hypothetical protein